MGAFYANGDAKAEEDLRGYPHRLKGELRKARGCFAKKRGKRFAKLHGGLTFLPKFGTMTKKREGR